MTVSTIPLSSLRHVTALVPDAQAAQRFLCAAFGAAALSPPEATAVDGGAETVACVGLGDVGIRFTVPGTSGRLRERFDQRGPMIDRLTFGTGSLAAAEVLAGTLGIASSRSCDGGVPSLRLETLARVGFDVELVEVVEPPPAARPLHGRVSPLLHVELAVDVLDEPLGLLSRAFGAAPVEQAFAAFLSSIGPMDIVHVGLGGVVLQYCRPKTAKGSWAALVRAQRRAIHNLTFLVPDMDETVAALRTHGAEDLISFALDFGRFVGADRVPASLRPQRIANLMPLLGFHLEVTEPFATNLDEHLLNPLSGWVAAHGRR